MLRRSKDRSIYGAIFFLVLLCFAGCDNYNQSIEEFIYYQTGTVLPKGQARIVSPAAEQGPDGAFHIRSAAADIVVELDLENDRGYDLRFGVLNNGAASETVRAEQTAPDRVLVRIDGAKPGDVFRIVVQAATVNGYRSFGEIPLPAIYCDAPLSGAKELLSFAFGSWTGTIDESAKTVAVTVPPGTAISGIIPTATVSAGADYSPKEAWGSGDSGSAKTYTVTAEDGTSADYAVTVTIALAPAYNIAVTPSANGTVTASAATAMEGATVTLTVNPASGYGLKPGTLLVNDGAVGISGSGPYSFVMPGMDVQITAEFASSAAPVYNIVVTPSTNGTVTASAATGMEGATVTLAVNPASGYGLKPGTLQVNGSAAGISGSGVSYSFVMPGMDVQITAEFASSAKELLSFTFGSWAGAVNDSAKTVMVTVPYGTAISGITPAVTVSAGADYSPKEAWGSGVSGSVKTYTVTAGDGTSADYAVTVTIAAAPVYNIDITPSTNGTVTASASTAIEGATVTLTVSPDSGYSLKPGTLLVNGSAAGISGSGVSYSFVMPGMDAQITAEFEVAPGQGSISVTFSGTPQDETTDLTGSPGGGVLDWATGNLTLAAPSTGVFAGASYQWYLDGKELAGETGSSYSAAGSGFTLARRQATVIITTSTGIVYAKAVVFVVE